MNIALSFRLKTILGIAFIEAILLTILVVYNISTLKLTNEKEIETRAKTTIGLFSSTARDAIFATDIATLQTLANELQSLPEIQYVRVDETNDRILASAGSFPDINAQYKIDTTVNSAQDGIFDISHTIEEAGQKYATIRIGFDIGAFQNTVEDATKRSLAIAAVEIFLVGLFSFLLGHYLTGQLRILRDGARHIANGELGFQIPVHGNDELAETAAAFNLMSLQVRKDNLIQKAIMESALDIIICIDINGNIVEFNKAAEELLGYKKSEVIDKYICDLIRPKTIRGNHDVDFRTFFENNLPVQLGKKFETKIQARSGELLPVEAVVNSTSDADAVPFYVFYFSDIRDRIQAEKLKDDFVSTVSHELRTPLTSIQGSLGLLNSNVLDGKSDEKQLLLKTAYSNSGRLLQLVNDLLDIQKIESGYIEINSAQYEVTDIIKKSLKQNQAYAEKFGVIIHYIESSLPIYINVDQDRILQVLDNLISNACKFSPQNGIVTISTSIEDEHIRVSIADQGVGIPSKFRQKIFSKFSQADSSSNRAYPGTGLGLAICKRLIEAHNGEIDFDTVENIGTEFYFILPIESMKKSRYLAISN